MTDQRAFLESLGITRVDLRCTYSECIYSEDEDGHDVKGSVDYIDEEYSFEGTIEEYLEYCKHYDVWSFEDEDDIGKGYDRHTWIDDGVLYGEWDNTSPDSHDYPSDHIPDHRDGSRDPNITCMRLETLDACGHVIRVTTYDGETAAVEDRELTPEEQAEYEAYLEKRREADIEAEARMTAAAIRKSICDIVRKPYSVKEVVSSKDLGQLDPSKVLYVYAAMSAYDPDYGDLVELAIYNGDKDIRFYRTFGPIGGQAARWDKNPEGIPWESVDNRRPLVLSDDVGEISSLIRSADAIVGYSLDTLYTMLSAVGVDIQDVRSCDLMLEYAERVGEWSEYWGGYTYQTLMSAVKRYKLPFGCGPVTVHKARVLIDLAEALASEEVEE